MATDRQLDEDMPAVKLMRKWGTNARFARALGKTPSTTDRWLVAGYVPGPEHAGVVEAGRRDDIIVRPTDFVDMRLFEGAGAPAVAG
jgi:hypothetical protein